ncbi:hypothetical protein F5H01DRAFT_76250 [Linnemannia elongata]|nr:hypothetical protein F5H01DRAFT_76250 [Linnemannia elongata]
MLSSLSYPVFFPTPFMPFFSPLSFALFFCFFSSVVVLPFSSLYLPTHPPSLPLFFFFPETPSPLHLIINSKVMIKQHSFPQSLQSFTTSSFYSRNLILPVHTHDSLVLHFFFIKSVVSISTFSVSLFSFSLFLSLLSCLLFVFFFSSVFFRSSLFSFFFLFFISLLSSFFFMTLSVATHCSFASFLSHESPPFCTSFLFSFLLSSPSPLSVLSSFSLPIFSFPFLFLLLQEITLHVICLSHSRHYLSLFLLLISLFLISVLFLSLPFFVLLPVYLLITNTFFFMGINVPSSLNF